MERNGGKYTIFFVNYNAILLFYKILQPWLRHKIVTFILPEIFRFALMFETFELMILKYRLKMTINLTKMQEFCSFC